MAETLHRDKKIYASYSDVGVKNKGVESFQLTATFDDNAVATTIYQIPVGELEGVLINIKAFGLRSTGAEAIRSRLEGLWRRAAAGNVTLAGALVNVTANDSGGTPVITLAANTTDQTVDLNVTGEAAKIIVFDFDIEIQRIKF
jgi:hypothetical protein